MKTLEDVDYRLSLLSSEHAGRCLLCKEDAFEKCKVENPSWFTKKFGDMKIAFRSKIESYVQRNIPLRNCLRIYFAGDLWDFGEEIYICSNHLSDIKNELDKI